MRGDGEVSRRTYSLFAMLMVLGVATVSFAETAFAEDLRIDDINRDYINQLVKLKGVVVSTEPDIAEFPGGKGVYTLKDEYGGSIKIRTMKLPYAGEQVNVRGTIFEDPDTGLLMLRQQQPMWLDEYLSYAIIFAVALVVILVVVLIILTTRGKKSEEPAIPLVEEQPDVSKAETTPVPPPAPTTKLLEPKASILVIEGPTAGKSYEIAKADMMIGRADECDIQLPESDTSVSRRHARIRHGSKQYTLINESQTNPAKVNGEETESRVLQDGDEIKIGSTKLQLKILSD